MPVGPGTVSIDAGTTLIKAVLFDATGAELRVAARPTALSHPKPGWTEQDMSEVLDAVISAVAEVADGSPIRIDRLAVTAQGDGAWPVDAQCRPVGPAILWNDGRAADVVRTWTADGTLDAAFSRNGSLGNMGLPHAILRWILAEEPERLTGVTSVLTCGSWLFAALTGRIGLHPSEASAPWLDVHTGEYSTELLARYGLGDAAALLPPVLRGAELTAGLLPGPAQACGLPPGVPLTLAPYDVITTAAGGGATRSGDAFCILGTTLCTGVLRPDADTSGPAAGLTLLGDAGAPIARVFPTLAGTGVVDWMAGMLGLPNAAAVTELAATAAPGAAGVRVLPYFSPAGERAPFLDADARGLIGGLHFGAGRAELARATIEGLALVVADCVAAADFSADELVLAGGGSASPFWCQVIADVTGVPTVRGSGSQIGAKGAMLYAAVAAGDHADVPAAADALLTRGDRFVPDPGATALYRERYRDFLDTRTALAPRWAAWAATKDRTK